MDMVSVFEKGEIKIIISRDKAIKNNIPMRIKPYKWLLFKGLQILD
jgi:hypothetical protein